MNCPKNLVSIRMEMSSFGGLVTKELGRIPEIGESLELKTCLSKF